MSNPTPLVLFDLDGTLVDPAGAITGGIRHALQVHGLAVPDDAVLRSMVGPPLAEGLASLPGVTPENLPDVVASYRTLYREHGMAQGRVYPGMTKLLGELRDRGVQTAVATQKPQTLAEQLLAVHQLSDFFDAVCGSSDQEVHDGGPAGPTGKSPIIQRALAVLQHGPEHAVMVGDRRHDVEAAQANGIECIGVAWGFAAAGELQAAGAAVVVDSAEQLEQELSARLNAPASAAMGA